ncbi:MAG: hypothetical protein WBF33_34025 [Candidatus Nitrosopolaris sp.]
MALKNEDAIPPSRPVPGPPCGPGTPPPGLIHNTSIHYARTATAISLMLFTMTFLQVQSFVQQLRKG